MPAVRQFGVGSPATAAHSKPLPSRSRRTATHLALPARVPLCLQWWGWALQTAFVLLTAIYWAAKSRNAGVLIIGACTTVLGKLPLCPH